MVTIVEDIFVDKECEARVACELGDTYSESYYFIGKFSHESARFDALTDLREFLEAALEAVEEELEENDTQ